VLISLSFFSGCSDFQTTKIKLLKRLDRSNHQLVRSKEFAVEKFAKKSSAK